MAQPNIVSVGTIYGNTAVAAVTNVSTNLVVNSASSGQVLKLNALYISNIHATGNTAVVSASVLRTGTEYRVASNIVLTANSTIYLQEGDCIRISANSTFASNANNYVEAVCSFEAIS